MTYPVIAAVLVVVAALVSLWLAPPRRGGIWPAIGLTAATLIVLTAVFDNLMIAADLFTYEESLTSGITLGLVPLEDFSYPLACALALPALWTRLRKGTADAGT